MPESSNAKFPGTGNSTWDAAEDATQGMKDRFTSTLGDVAGKARKAAADAPNAMSDLADEAADRIGRASDYVRDIDLKDVWANVQTFVKARPAESLLAALACGFLVGRLGARRM